MVEKQEETRYITAYNTLSFDRKDVIYFPLETGYVKGSYLQQRTETVDGKKVLAVTGVRLSAFASKSFEITEDVTMEQKSPFDLQGKVRFSLAI